MFRPLRLEVRAALARETVSRITLPRAAPPRLNDYSYYES